MAALIPCLDQLRDEIDARWPSRDRRSDGWKGDAAHQLRVSDHNPDSRGLVHAIDVDVDGIPADAIVHHLTGAPRLKYVIYNRFIWSRTVAWAPARYTGTNPHIGHFHASADSNPGHEQDRSPWGIATIGAGPRPPVKPAGIRTLRLTDPRMTGADVAFVQRWLDPRAGKIDGVFGPRTDAAVRWYQRMRGITADGIVGAVTWKNMGMR
jgi:peptidoglycan hydrolase-like protein with peptidoglycan-binding domain